MKLSNKALSRIQGLDRETTNRLKGRLSLEMAKSVYSVDRWFDQNESNGPLTTAKALQVIREETGLSDTEILEESDRIAV